MTPNLRDALGIAGAVVTGTATELLRTLRAYTGFPR